MDNLKYYNDSLAYDFDMFMPRQAEVIEKPDNIVRLPSKAKARRRKAQTRSLSASAFAVLIATLILAALCGNIFLRLQINEVNSQVNDIREKINVLDSEKTSLEVEFERRISYSNIETEAAEMGMCKMDKDQVRYIRVNDKNTAVTKDGETIKAK